jgi:molybdenum cofactor synthesis domain-containing protein
VRVVVLTVSDRASAGEYQDLTGPAVEQLVVAALGAVVVGRELVPDEADVIAGALVRWCDGGTCDLVLTNGGTGLSPRDVTPEATRGVLDAEAPGIGELMRAAGRAATPLAALSRSAAGRRGHTLVVNLPGSVRGATESLEALLEVLPHAVAMAGNGR